MESLHSLLSFRILSFTKKTGLPLLQKLFKILKFYKSTILRRNGNTSVIQVVIEIHVSYDLDLAW